MAYRKDYKNTQIYGVVTFIYDDYDRDKARTLLCVVINEYRDNSTIEVVLTYYDGKPCYCRKTSFLDNLIQSVEKETMFTKMFLIMRRLWETCICKGLYNYMRVLKLMADNFCGDQTM